MKKTKFVTVADLISILEKMRPNAEISIYCESDHMSKDFKLENTIEFINEETAMIVLGISEETKEEIYQDVNIQDTRDVMSYLNNIDDTYLFDNEIDEIIKEVDENLMHNSQYQEIKEQEIYNVTKKLYPEAITDSEEM